MFLTLLMCASCENPWMREILEPKTITFDSNGGSHVSSQDLIKGKKVTRPTNPSRAGFAFDAWYIDNGTFEKPWNFNIVPTYGFTLYAKWNLGGAAVQFVEIAAGTAALQFQMGQNGDGSTGNVTPVHTVTFTRGFSMGKYPVTQAQWQAVMGTNPSHFTSGADAGETQSRRPVEMVSWYDALVFCNKLSMKEGLSPAYSIVINGTPTTNPDSWGDVPTSAAHANYATWNAVTIVSGSNGYRLPTEAQWEYAAKGGPLSKGYICSGSDNVDDVAWYKGNSGDKTHEVGKKLPNELGLYDMNGNVIEWCWDWFETPYQSNDQIDPVGASMETSGRSYRGGTWGVEASHVSSVYRNFDSPYTRVNNAGFRLLRP